MVSKSKPIDRITILLQSGLARDPRRIAYYRQILQSPRSSFNNTIYRDLAAELLDTLVNYCLNDQQIFNRLRNDLLADRNLSEAAYNALVKKSEKYNIPLNNLIEDYNKGYSSPHWSTRLTPEQRGFNHVNANIARILEMREKASDREIGTDSALQNFLDDTPGQSKTLQTIRKVIKDK